MGSCQARCQVLVTGILPAGGPGPENLTNAGSATALSNHQGAFSTAVALDCHVCTQGYLRRKHPRERIAPKNESANVAQVTDREANRFFWSSVTKWERGIAADLRKGNLD